MSFSRKNHFSLTDPLVQLVMIILEDAGQSADQQASGDGMDQNAKNDPVPSLRDGEKTGKTLAKYKNPPENLKDALGGSMDGIDVNPVVRSDADQAKGDAFDKNSSIPNNSTVY